MQWLGCPIWVGRSPILVARSSTVRAGQISGLASSRLSRIFGKSASLFENYRSLSSFGEKSKNCPGKPLYITSLKQRKYGCQIRCARVWRTISGCCAWQLKKHCSWECTQVGYHSRLRRRLRRTLRSPEQPPTIFLSRTNALSSGRLTRDSGELS